MVVYEPNTSPAKRQVGNIGGLGTISFSAAANKVVWEQDFLGGRSEIVTATLGKAGQRVLLAPSKQGINHVVVAGRYVYWDTLRGLGRVRLAGGRPDFSFLRLPPVPGADPVTDLVSDGHTLYFSECERDRIGRIQLSRAVPDPKITWLTGLSCPQSIALANHFIYFANLNRTIGRIDLLTRHVDDDWLDTGAPGAVMSVAAAGHYLYWDATTRHRGQRPREFLGRVNPNKPTHLDQRLWRLADSDLAEVTPTG